MAKPTTFARPPKPVSFDRQTAFNFGANRTPRTRKGGAGKAKKSAAAGGGS